MLKTLIRKWKMYERASSIVFVLMLIAIFTLVLGGYLTAISSGSIGTARIADQERAFYGAEAGIYRQFYELKVSAITSLTGTLNAGTFSVSYATVYNNSQSSSTTNLTAGGQSLSVLTPAYGIAAMGTAGTMTRAITVQTLAIPPYVGGAATVNSSVTTSGNIVIDGRDHNADGSLTGDPGVDGISCAGTITQTGSSTIGGNGNAPASPALPSSMEQLVNPFPSTQPWDILGVSQAWFQANVPVHDTPPPAGSSGIYYYTPPSGTWNPVDLGNSSGILIVHNADNTATMKNLNGTFTGLIISDQITHINGTATIYGAVITTNQVGNTLGNGNALVAYSSSVLSGLGVLVGSQTGSWKRTLQTGSWKEQ